MYVRVYAMNFYYFDGHALQLLVPNFIPSVWNTMQRR